ncbi:MULTISPECIES: ExbD/TolR family protein [Sphingobium]|uniref:Biopolymer transport protein ExbD n=1 Tax=Sphingobium lignivorans TaxID=2735886 RepID=A0ABR6NE23_9SPHN|nr:MULTISPECIES: biopolymer transporter ExbD [Sphingobium]MBB5985501.1 biopolymer transport protein ExbD [Sphingobium lignivorans]BAK66121.1 biopolymer transport protein ExbD [Sphingobium sp. SYK-6]
MAMSGGRDDGEPMMEMNTTPLIDVMLVLLIMFIITIPIQTHAVKIDLPQNADAPQNAIDPVKNRLTIDPAGVIYWNGSPIDRVLLRQYLEQTAAMAPEPELQFEPDQSARYVVVDEVLAAIKRAKVTKLGFVGNERYGGVF